MQENNHPDLLSGSVTKNIIRLSMPLFVAMLFQTYELVMQLRGKAEKRQVDNPRIAMAENGGGTLGQAEAAMNIHIYEKM